MGNIVTIHTGEKFEGFIPFWTKIKWFFRLKQMPKKMFYGGN